MDSLHDTGDIPDRHGLFLAASRKKKIMKGLKKWLPLLIPAIAIVGTISYVAWRTRRIPTPRRRWKRFDNPGTTPLTVTICNRLQGIYAIKEGNEFFGDTAVLKCSYKIEKEEKLFER